MLVVCCGVLSACGVLPLVLPVVGSLGLVGLDAADVVGSALHQLAHQLVGLSLNTHTHHEYRE